MLVGSSQATTITTAGTIDFSGVPADTEHLVWVDESHCEDFGKTTLNGGQDGIIPEPDDYAATTPGPDDTISGYYKTLQAAVSAAPAGGSASMLKSSSEAVEVGKAFTVFRTSEKYEAPNLTAAACYAMNGTDDAYEFVEE